MKNILAGIALSSLIAAPAMAADIPARMPVKGPAPAAVVAAYNWTGCYIGVQGGYAWGRTSLTLVTTGTNEFDLDGGVAGGHIGCNLHTGGFVFGIEGDGEWTGLKGDDDNFGGTIDELKGRWQASFRGRLGFAADRTLFYATGGIAWLGVRAARPNFDTEVLKDTFTGWTVGGGIEHAFSHNFSARIEYRYSRFDGDDFVFAAGTVREYDWVRTHTIRGGITYRFGAGPVVARY